MKLVQTSSKICFVAATVALALSLTLSLVGGPRWTHVALDVVAIAFMICGLLTTRL